jgi:hypothetical protein
MLCGIGGLIDVGIISIDSNAENELQRDRQDNRTSKEPGLPGLIQGDPE